MLTDADLVIKMDEIMESLDQSLDDVLQAGIKRSKLDAEYQILKRKEMLKQKSEGISVTLIDKFVSGVEEVALAKQAKDNAEVIEDTIKERINALKLELRVLNDQAGREWSVRSSDYQG
jgi:hypothetical protein